MKILQISSAQAFGGGERHLADLTNELVRRGHDVYAVVRPHSPLESRLGQLTSDRIRTLPLRNALDVASANELARLAKRLQTEIIHAHMARDYSLAAYAARRNPATKLIVTRHVLFPLNRWHRRLLIPAARVIAVSEAVAEQLRSQNLVPPSLISVVHNGVDVEALAGECRAFDRNELRRSWGMPPDSLVVGTIGQLNPLKGHDVLIRAAALILQSVPTARFVVAGSDPAEGKETLSSLSKLIRESGLQDHFFLLGEQENIASVLAGLDLYVSPSRAESFGLAIVEAMSCSLPVVASDTLGAREVVVANETGVFVPIDDAGLLASSILRFLNDPETRSQMGAAGYSRAQTCFGLKRMVDVVEKIYQGD